MPSFKKGQTVTVYMGFTTTGTYVGKEGAEHLIDVDDPRCGAGIFGFERWDDEKQRFTTETTAR